LLTTAGGASARFRDDFRARFGRDPASSDVLYGVQALQVILAAIAKSDGTRRGVRDQVFDGAGITIAADRAIVGKTISIDPATGDTNINDVTVLLVKDGEETLVKAVSEDCHEVRAAVVTLTKASQSRGDRAITVGTKEGSRHVCAPPYR
jgi:branched-chain amino acid transport system substrate-binding protein